MRVVDVAVVVDDLVGVSDAVAEQVLEPDTCREPVRGDASGRVADVRQW